MARTWPDDETSQYERWESLCEKEQNVWRAVVGGLRRPEAPPSAALAAQHIEMRSIIASMADRFDGIYTTNTSLHALLARADAILDPDRARERDRKGPECSGSSGSSSAASGGVLDSESLSASTVTAPPLAPSIARTGAVGTIADSSAAARTIAPDPSCDVHHFMLADGICSCPANRAEPNAGQAHDSDRCLTCEGPAVWCMKCAAEMGQRKGPFPATYDAHGITVEGPPSDESMARALGWLSSEPSNVAGKSLYGCALAGPSHFAQVSLARLLDAATLSVSDGSKEKT